MKIVFVTSPLSTGGAERVVASLANKFYEMGNEIKIIIIDNGDKNTYYTDPAIEFFHIAKKTNPIQDLLSRAKIMKNYFSDYKPDIIIPFTTQKNVSVLLATLFTKHKVIACERSNPATDPKDKLLRALRKLLLWSANGYVFQTEEAKKYFSKSIQKRAGVIPNPMKEDIDEPWTGIREKKIVMASRMDPVKNLDMAIDVMKEISKTHPDYRLEIFGKSYNGDYEYENTLKARVKDENLQDIVVFKGFSTNVHEEIKSATIFLITSNHEGMSNSLMEAMAIGLPCISTDDSNGGARALIRDHENGFLIPVGGTKECVAAIEEIITNDSLRENVSKNAMNIRGKLDSGVIATKWMEYIVSIAGRV